MPFDSRYSQKMALNDHLVVKGTLAVLFCSQVLSVASAVLLSTSAGSSLVNEGFVSFMLLGSLNCQPFYLPQRGCREAKSYASDRSRVYRFSKASFWVFHAFRNCSGNCHMHIV